MWLEILFEGYRQAPVLSTLSMLQVLRTAECEHLSERPVTSRDVASYQQVEWLRRPPPAMDEAIAIRCESVARYFGHVGT